MSILKKLFCKHEYELKNTERQSYKVDNFSEPWRYIVVNEICYTYKCKHCGKTKREYKEV